MGCKEDFINQKNRDIFRFYLNYVGCKVGVTEDLPSATIEGFTLTMWDVKEEEEKKRRKEVKVLP